MDKIIVNNLTKDYGHGRGIYDVSFSVKEGEVFGFLGPNGAGKSTTMRHLMGFSKPQKGKAGIDRLDCWKQHGIDSLENFKYATLFTLYDYASVLSSGEDWIIKAIVAGVIALVGYFVGGAWFCKKDLPL